MCTSSLRCSRHSLALREKLVAALNTDETHASKGSRGGLTVTTAIVENQILREEPCTLPLSTRELRSPVSLSSS